MNWLLAEKGTLCNDGRRRNRRGAVIVMDQTRRGKREEGRKHACPCGRRYTNGRMVSGLAARAFAFRSHKARGSGSLMFREHGFIGTASENGQGEERPIDAPERLLPGPGRGQVELAVVFVGGARVGLGNRDDVVGDQRAVREMREGMAILIDQRDVKINGAGVSKTDALKVGVDLKLHATLVIK